MQIENAVIGERKLEGFYLLFSSIGGNKNDLFVGNFRDCTVGIEIDSSVENVTPIKTTVGLHIGATTT
jgi:hypothetical protein